MSEYPSPHNRWEQLSLGESSLSSDIVRVSQFAGEFELRSTKLPKKAPKDSSIVYRSLLDLLYVALQGDILTHQRIKHFRDIGDKDAADRSSRYGYNFMRASHVEDTEPAYGHANSNEERTVFITTRSWSNTSRAPHISGIRIGKKLRIMISSTSDAANPYNSQVLPGIHEIIIGEKGDMIVSGWRRGDFGERPKMDIIRKHRLAGILDNCKNELSGRLERSRKYFQQIKSPTQPQGL